MAKVRKEIKMINKKIELPKLSDKEETIMETRIGKIESVTFGIGGPQDACLGLHLTFSGKGWCAGTALAAWDYTLIKRSERTKWTEESRNEEFINILKRVSDTLAKAKVSSVEKLKGIPVELTFEDNTLREWRVLDELL